MKVVCPMHKASWVGALIILGATACTPLDLSELPEASATVGPSPTQSPTPALSPTPEVTPTLPPSPSPDVTPTPTPSPTPTPTPTLPPGVDQDNDGSALEFDCDDTDPTRYPGAPELCDGLDNDCNSFVDDSLETSTFYADQDDDGYGDPGKVLVQCPEPDGYVLTTGDCDDEDPNIHPDAAELCNDVDDNCDDSIDETEGLYYPDTDLDGYGDATAETVLLCLGEEGVSSNNSDCNDLDPAVYPNAPETCDEIDHNCNGSAAGTALTYYPDEDGDGFGTDAGKSQEFCEPTLGFSLDAYDCQDDSATVHPMWVDGDNGSADGQGTYLSPLNKIPLAIPLTNNCGLVLVAAGLYPDFVSVDKRQTPLTIRGVEGSATTLIETSTATRPLTIADSKEIVIEGFTLKTKATGALAGGCASIINGDEITLRDVVASGCKVGSGLNGGGMYIAKSPMVSLHDCTIENSQGTAGGGMQVVDSFVTIEDSSFHNNRATVTGGGVQVIKSSGLPNVQIWRTSFVDNTADDYGGGASADGIIPLEIYDSYFEGNIATKTLAGAVHNPSLVMRSSFIQNLATGSDNYSDGGAMTLRQNAYIANSIFMGNEALYAGAINTNEYDGQDGYYRLVNNTFVDNNARSNTTPGDTFYFFSGNQLEFKQNILISQDDRNRVAFFVLVPTLIYDISFNHFFVSEGSVFGGLNGNITDGNVIGKDGNITSDVLTTPIFVSYTTGQYLLADLHLKPGARGVDEGDPEGAQDPDGTRADMGAYGGPNALP